MHSVRPRVHPCCGSTGDDCHNGGVSARARRRIHRRRSDRSGAGLRRQLRRVRADCQSHPPSRGHRRGVWRRRFGSADRLRLPGTRSRSRRFRPGTSTRAAGRRSRSLASTKNVTRAAASSGFSGSGTRTGFSSRSRSAAARGPNLRVGVGYTIRRKQLSKTRRSVRGYRSAFGFEVRRSSFAVRRSCPRGATHVSMNDERRTFREGATDGQP